MNEAWETGLAPVMLHVLMNELGVAATAARTLLERWQTISETQRESLLAMIDDAVGKGIGQVATLATAASR